ncbi:MAG: hypothetical protein IPO27_05485 [Bacteroidetes bacterium]|nr:hypothetical protein [Bacteroidota bacterium]
MRNSKADLLLIVVVSIFASCKNDGDTAYIITGTVYQNSIAAPIPNKKVELYKEATTSFPYQPGKVIASTYTNNQGAFNIESNDQGIFTLQFSQTEKVIYNYKSGDPLDGVLLFTKPLTNLTINLNVTNAYTSADTLFLLTTDAAGNQYKFGGPFTSGKLTTLSHYQFQTNVALNAGKYNTQNILGYAINRVKVIESTVDFNGTLNAQVTLKIE